MQSRVEYRAACFVILKILNCTFHQASEAVKVRIRLNDAWVYLDQENGEIPVSQDINGEGKLSDINSSFDI